MTSILEERTGNDTHYALVSQSSRFCLELLGYSLEPLLAPMSSTQKVKALRLVPIMRDDSLPVPNKMTVPAFTSWRCPICKIPLLLSGDTCYCRRCGFTRPLTDGKQSIST
jgi:hypothetical protein